MPSARTALPDLETIHAFASRLKLRAAILLLLLAEMLMSAPWLRAALKDKLRAGVHRLARSFKGVLVLQALAFTGAAQREAAAPSAPGGFRLARPKASALRRLTRGLFRLRGDFSKRISALRALMETPATLVKKLVARVKRGLWRTRLVIAAPLADALYEGATPSAHAASDTS